MIAHLDPEIWGPQFWGFLHTAAMTYPNHPNAITKKKYYDLIQSVPQFIPVEQMSSDFSRLLEQYPVTPYLDNKESLVRWTWYIHNKVNDKLEKPRISLQEVYRRANVTRKQKLVDNYHLREKGVYFATIAGLIGIIYFGVKE
jgi:hypothetical protein